MPERVHQLVEQFITQQGFYIVREAPDIETCSPAREGHQGYLGTRIQGCASCHGRSRCAAGGKRDGTDACVASVKMPLLGGSVPMYLFTDVLKTPVVGLPIANHDNNQHGANENLRLQNLWDELKVFAGIWLARRRTGNNRHAPAIPLLARSRRNVVVVREEKELSPL